MTEKTGGDLKCLICGRYSDECDCDRDPVDNSSRFEDFIIAIRVGIGLALFYVAWVPLRIAAWLLVFEPLDAMEIHTAYYRYVFDKEHGEGAVDLISSFYDAYLDPKNLIEWM